MQNELTAERVDASIEYMEEMYRCCDTQTGNVPKAYLTAIAALRAEQERQWISVQDRLPDMCGCKCLVAAVNKFGQTEVFTAFIGHMERGKLEFHSCEPTHEIPAWTVTHWIPLPEPPKDELKGE